MASPADGGMPITSFTVSWNSSIANTLGGLWFGDSLKGIIYNLVAKDAALN
jgi:hypothetical protein